jgi:hypothetical protein
VVIDSHACDLGLETRAVHGTGKLTDKAIESVFDPEEAAHHAQWGAHQAPYPGYTDTYDGARLGEKK